MAYDLEEQESIDQMKAWWDRWGTPITAAVCVVCLGFAAWNGWHWYQSNQAGKASVAYIQLEEAVRQSDVKNIDSISDGLMKEYASTVYAPMAALASASAQYQLGNADGAVTRLRWVIEESGFPEYDTDARIRLAGIYLSQDKLDEALTTLEAAKPNEMQIALYEDRRGDIFYAKKDFAAARTAWKKALEADSSEPAFRSVVNLKLDALPEAE